MLSVQRTKNGMRKFLSDSDLEVAVVELAAGRPGVQEWSTYSCSDPRQRVRVNFTFADFIDRKTFIDVLGIDVKSALVSQYVLLDKIKNVSAFMKIVLSVGKEISELNNIAKVVFGLANKLFKVLQEQQKFHHMALDLADLLNVKLHVSDIIPEKLQQNSVQKSLKNMLNIIEETLTFIKTYINSNSLSKLITRREELTDLKAKLFAASEDLSLCLTANVFVMVSDVHQNTHNAVLKEKLKPVLPARSSINHDCLKGTREAPLECIMDWANSLAGESTSKLYYVHGVAGSGKSSMASTICEKLEDEKLLAGAFFCKRDVPDQRDPSRILPSLSFTLALCHEEYKKRVVLSLKNEPDITSRSIEQQLKVLFREPLSKLPQISTLSKPFIFVVDALDECSDEILRPRLADSLCQIATLTDWLKVLVTSRPTNKLMRKFSPSDKPILSVNLNDTDAGDDIKLYTRASLKELVDDSGLSPTWLTEDTVQKLSDLASGLFIWTSTMIKFVRSQLDMDNAMNLVLSGRAVAAEASLDSLYIKVIESCGSGDDNLTLTKTVLGIIFITARNRPLSVDGLHDFLQGSGRKVSKGTLIAVINHLRSVLYEDISKGNAIRVCHPSFLDFLEHRERCGVYWTNTEQLHVMMVETSINLMKTMLRFNICSLKSSYVANKDIGDLQQRIKDSIPESLIYGCLYWATHLTEANCVTVDLLATELFQSLGIIYWIEVLSLVEEVKIGLDALERVMGFFKDNKTLCSLAIDLYRLVSSSYDAISHSTPHLYISALVWLPEECPLRPMLSHMKSDALIATGRAKNWPSMLWMYTLNGNVRHVVFSPDNKTVAACSTDGNIAFFDAKTGIMKMKLQNNESAVCSIAYSPDGKRLVSGSIDHSVTIWDVGTGEIVGNPLTGHSKSVISVAYSPDGQFIASSSAGGEIKIWNAQSGAAIRAMEGCREYGRLAYSHDGTKIACCGVEGIIIRDAQSGELLYEKSDIGHVEDVTYSQDGKFLASGGGDGSIRVWDAETLFTVAEFSGHESFVYSVIFSNESTLFSASDEGRMIRWDMTSCRMSGVAVQEATIQSVACSSDGRLFASASQDGSLRVWGVDSHFGAEIPSVKYTLGHVACSPGGSEIASASRSGEIHIHSFVTGDLLRTLRGHNNSVRTVVYSPNGKLLVSGSDDNTIRIWDAATGLELRKLEGHIDGISAIAFLPDGKKIFSSSFDGTIRRWDIDEEDTAEANEDSQTRANAIWCMCASKNERLLVFGGFDSRIGFGDIFNGETKELRIELYTAIRALSLSPDDIYLASGSEDQIVRLWHLETQTEVRRFIGHTNNVLSVSFSRDGQELLSSSGDNIIRQWKVDTGEEIRQLKGHSNGVCHSIYSVDEKHIISCSDDGTIRIWNADTEENDYIAEIDEHLSSLELRDGWIKSKTGELLLWVPSEYRNGVRDMCERCIPADAPNHPVRLHWSKLVKGENWTDVFASSTEGKTTTS